MDVAVQENWLIHQMDVKTAYLNADIDCDIYVEQPSGFIKSSQNSNDLVYKLKKSLYGLKQSGRNWNNLLHNFLLSQDFVQSLCDNCVYTKHMNSSKIIIIVWVDDLIIAASDINKLNEIKQSLSLKFKMKDLGVVSWFLGIEFNIKDNLIEMNQSKYVEKILTKFKMSDCNPKATPCNMTTSKLDKNLDSKELTDSKLYREIVGSLIYLMTCTRPDICYVVTKLSQYLSKPTFAHLSLSRFVLKYLKGTVNYGLKFIKSEKPLSFTGFCDSDWGGSVDRKSTTGYCYKISENSSLISWRSKRQNTVALSTCEAEYMALTYAIQEGNFLRQLLSDITDCDKMQINLYVDNRGAIDLAKNPVHHQRSKHIDIRYHYIRSQIKDDIIFVTLYSI